MRPRLSLFSPVHGNEKGSRGEPFYLSLYYLEYQVQRQSLPKFLACFGVEVSWNQGTLPWLGGWTLDSFGLRGGRLKTGRRRGSGSAGPQHNHRVARSSASRLAVSSAGEAGLRVCRRSRNSARESGIIGLGSNGRNISQWNFARCDRGF